MSNNKTEVSDNLIHGETKSGFEFWIDKRILNDWRFITLIKKMTNGSDIEKITSVEEALRLIFGDVYDAFINHISNKNEGFVPSEKIIEEFVEIVNSIKNSTSSPTA